MGAFDAPLEIVNLFLDPVLAARLTKHESSITLKTGKIV